jgi:hypothetical protein
MVINHINPDDRNGRDIWNTDMVYYLARFKLCSFIMKISNPLHSLSFHEVYFYNYVNSSKESHQLSNTILDDLHKAELTN